MLLISVWSNIIKKNPNKDLVNTPIAASSLCFIKKNYSYGKSKEKKS